MIFNMIGGGSGVKFNFTVVGNPKPESSQENTIWIDTDTPITSWHFCASEPSSYEEGDVWIQIGNSSLMEFNILKENGIMAYPLLAYQYVGGAWVKRSMQGYQNGEWDYLIMYLYNHGDTCNDLTDGYNVYHSGSEYGDTSFTFEEERLFIDIGGGSQGTVITKKPIDLTNISTLYCVIDSITTSSHTTIAIKFVASSTAISAYPESIGEGDAEIKWKPAIDLSNATKTLSLDVSSLIGEKYICISCFSNARLANAQVYISEIKGE